MGLPVLVALFLGWFAVGSFLFGAGKQVRWWKDSARQNWDRLIQELRACDSFTLISVDGEMGRWQRPEMRPQFEGLPILGFVAVTNWDSRETLISALHTNAGDSGPLAMCFTPRHGILATRGTNTTKLVICFECMQIKGASPAGNFDALIEQEAAVPFNQVLREAGVAIAK